MFWGVSWQNFKVYFGQFWIWHQCAGQLQSILESAFQNVDVTLTFRLLKDFAHFQRQRHRILKDSVTSTFCFERFTLRIRINMYRMKVGSRSVSNLLKSATLQSKMDQKTSFSYKTRVSAVKKLWALDMVLISSRWEKDIWIAWKFCRF